MIGLFGLFHNDRAYPANTQKMLSSIDKERYRTDCRTAKGVAFGAVFHKHGVGFSACSSADGDLDVLISGEIFLDDTILVSVAPEIPANAAELILALYRKDRLEALGDANGLFSVVVYDHANHALTLITDRYSGYPIHYAEKADKFVFAGQMHVLLAEGSVPRKADSLGIAELFTMQRTVGEDTNVAGIKAMPAATILRRDRNGLTHRNYWQLKWKSGFSDEYECAAAITNTLRTAVERQSGNGAVAPGLLLSGGLDSRLVLGAAQAETLSSWTTASYAENPELEIARQTAKVCHSSFHPLVVEPGDTLNFLDQTTIDSNGLYPASTQMSSFMPAVEDECDVVLTGHGLDYTFRGYYLPSRFLKISGSATRLPILRSIPRQPTGADILQNLRQGPPLSTIKRIVRNDRKDAWWRGQEERLDQVLAPWLHSDTPVNAWDAFILHNLSKHYAFTGMMTVRAATHLRIPTYDRDLFDVYLKMPPEMRIKGGAIFAALNLISPELARMPNANTGFRANLGPWREIAALLIRATARRVGIVSKQQTPSSVHSAGSWQNVGNLYRDEPSHRAHFLAIRDRLDALTLDLLDADQLAACIDEHLSGEAKHTKLLRYLMTHDAWVRHFGIQ